MTLQKQQLRQEETLNFFFPTLFNHSVLFTVSQKQKQIFSILIDWLCICGCVGSGLFFGGEVQSLYLRVLGVTRRFHNISESDLGHFPSRRRKTVLKQSLPPAFCYDDNNNNYYYQSIQSQLEMHQTHTNLESGSLHKCSMREKK